MLELINAERVKAGVPPVVLGDNVAAQLHAEDALENCFSSHWGSDGLKHYMRYSLAGGHHSNGENVSGIDYCIAPSSGYAALGPIMQEIREAVDGLMRSSGHRDTILRQRYRKVNVGLAWDTHNFKVVQQFEGDHVEYTTLPVIEDGRLTFSGTVKNGVEFLGSKDLSVGIFYDPPPHPLTRGQIARTYCSGTGPAVAFLRQPLTGRSRYTEDEFTRTYSPCPDPYDVPADTPPPRSPGEAHDLWEAAYEASQKRPESTITGQWVTASEWHVKDSSFSVNADLSGILADHGSGVYTIILWGWQPDTASKITISQYSIFHDITPPDTYSQMAVATVSPTGADTPTPVPTATPTPTSTSTSTPTSANVAGVSLSLGASTTLIGYWSDGMANVEVAVSLRNEGSSRLDGAQKVVLTCIADSGASGSCHEEASLSLEDGFGPTSGHFVLRLPMGRTSLEIHYGGDESLRLDLDVPQRILGIEHEVWECYSDRSLEPVVSASHDDADSCGGWAIETVEKWLNDATVKVWAAGDDRYIEVLREVLDELSPVLDLEFQWVDAESQADLKAFVGIPRSARAKYGFDMNYYDYYVDYAGFGGARTRNGEALSGQMVVWLQDSDEWTASNRDDARHVTMHEALHALVPIGHSTRLGSVMGGSYLKKLSPMDESLIRLNSHLLVKPGMTMAEVRNLIVFRDDLLDAPPPREPDTHEMVWRAAIALWEAGSARFKIRGGWPERNCGMTFGVRRGLATLEIGNFGSIPYGGVDLARFDDLVNTFWMHWSSEDVRWRYWSEADGDLTEVGADHVEDGTAWWMWNEKVLWALGSLLNDSNADDISVAAHSNGTITLQATLDESYPTYGLDSGEAIDLTLVLDEESYEIEGYTYEYRSRPDPDYCNIYEEVAEEVELGIEIEVPDVILRVIEGASQ